jgi:hypothetical protein
MASSLSRTAVMAVVLAALVACRAFKIHGGERQGLSPTMSREMGMTYWLEQADAGMRELA